MKVFDLMTKVADDADDVRFDEPNHLAKRGGSGGKSVRDKLIYFSDDHLGFSDIPMPEVEIVAYYEWKGERIGEVHTTMKLKRIMRYQHLSADIEDDYPQNQEYFLYSDDKVNIYHIDVRKCHLMETIRQNAYISHCPSKYPDFQQQVQLDCIPRCESVQGEQVNPSFVVMFSDIVTPGFLYRWSCMGKL